MEEQISVLVVDDVPLIRDTVKILLMQGNYATVVGEAENGKKAIDLVATTRPDVILMDIDMPVMNGIEAANAIKQNNDTAKIVMLTSINKDEAIFDSFAAGADGYILKDKFPTTIHSAITTVRLGSVWLDPAIARRILELAGGSFISKNGFEAALTRQELETLNNVAGCNGNRCLVDPGFVSGLRRMAYS